MKKRIKLISTGGTIACKQTDRGLSPELSADEMLLELDPDILSDKELSSVDLFSMDSSNVQPEEWITISEEISKTALSHEYDAIVLTHGTDTMAYTASMLSFMLCNIDIPIVITGAQYPIAFPDSDGKKNLGDAIIAASKLNKGVYICFGGDVILGCRAVKTHTVSIKAFESINYPVLATIKENQFVKKYESNCGSIKYEGNAALINPRVALIKLIPGTVPELISSVASFGMQGVVIEGFGLGGVHNVRRDHNEAIISLIKRGIAVVLTSQCLYEASKLDVYAVSRTLMEAGAISAHDMTTEAAVTKLMWALGQGGAVEELMRRNICGEICDHI